MEGASESDLDEDYFSALDDYNGDSTDVYLNSDSHAAYVRAAMKVWHWLSCCPGYSGRENERFWKMVLSAIQQPRIDDLSEDEEASPKPESDIDDYACFLDGAVFPVLHESDFLMSSKPRRSDEERLETIRVLLGGMHTPHDLEIDTQLKAIYEKLEPYMTTSKLCRRIPVQVKMDDPTAIDAVLEIQPEAPFADPTVLMHSVSPDPILLYHAQPSTRWCSGREGGPPRVPGRLALCGWRERQSVADASWPRPDIPAIDLCAVYVSRATDASACVHSLGFVSLDGHQVTHHRSFTHHPVCRGFMEVEI